MTAPTLAVGFVANPASIVVGGEIRFFPYVYDSTGTDIQWPYPIVTWAWSFNSGEATSAVPNPTWTPAGSTGVYPVSVTVTDSQGNIATSTVTHCITIGTSVSVPVPPNDGTYQAISVLLYNETESALVTRVPPNGTVPGFSNFYLMYPDIVNNLDKMGTATFSLLDTGNSTATDQSLNTTGTFVMIFSGQNLVFSGKIQTSSQSTQNGFSSTNAVILWNVTCESDYGKLLALNVPAAALDPNGYALVDSPGDIARRILQPVAGIFGDWRGKICCEDIQIGFQLNSANNLQSAGDIYDKMETLRVQSTYDLRTRMDYLIFEYSTFTY